MLNVLIVMVNPPRSYAAQFSPRGGPGQSAGR